MASRRQQDELMKYGKWAVVGLVGYIILKPALSSAQSISASLVTKAENTAKQQITGLSKAELTLCKDVASKVDVAMYQRGFWQLSWFGGSTEDEEAVITNLNRLSTFEQAQETSDQYYKVTNGKSLASDVNQYLDYDDKARILPSVLSGLK